MGKVPIVKISEISKYRKEFIEIDDSLSYLRCRVQLHKRGVILRDKINGVDIKTKKQRLCKPNDFIVAEMDAKFGGYGIIPDFLENAIVSSHYYLYELDKDKILPDYLYVLIDTDVIQNQIKAQGSTNYSRVSPTEVLDFEIPCPSIDEQKKIINFYLNSKNILLSIKSEFIIQSSYLSLLRQSILQEAIEGKLTEEWRKEQENSLTKGSKHTEKELCELRALREKNPEYSATALLEKIKEEKRALTKGTKHTKREKELPPIKPGEVPFGLPEGWVWCRLGEVADCCLGKMLDAHKNKGKPYPYLRNLNVRWFDFNLSDLKQIKVQDHELFKCSAKKGDLLICEGGYPGRGAIWDSDDSIVIQKAIHRVRFYIQDHNIWFLFFLKLLDMNRDIEQYFTGSGIQHLTGEKLKTIVFPLPTLAEQHAIVERVDRLLAMVDELEKQVAERKGQAEELMQAVLREAFEG